MTSTDGCSRGLGSSPGLPSSLQVNCHPDMSRLAVDRQAADGLAHRAPSEPAPMVRQSLGSPSPQETGPGCTGAPFTHTHTQTHTSGLRASGGSGGGQGRPQELWQRSSPQAGSHGDRGLGQASRFLLVLRGQGQEGSFRRVGPQQ